MILENYITLKNPLTFQLVTNKTKYTLKVCNAKVDAKSLGLVDHINYKDLPDSIKQMVVEPLSSKILGLLLVDESQKDLLQCVSILKEFE